MSALGTKLLKVGPLGLLKVTPLALLLSLFGCETAYRLAYLQSSGCGITEYQGAICWTIPDFDQSVATEDHNACMTQGKVARGGLQAFSWADQNLGDYCFCMTKKGYHRVPCQYDRPKICRHEKEFSGCYETREEPLRPGQPHR